MVLLLFVFTAVGIRINLHLTSANNLNL